MFVDFLAGIYSPVPYWDEGLDLDGASRLALKKTPLKAEEPAEVRPLNFCDAGASGSLKDSNHGRPSRSGCFVRHLSRRCIPAVSSLLSREAAGRRSRMQRRRSCFPRPVAGNPLIIPETARLPKDRQAGHRRIRNLPLCDRAVRLLRWNAEQALPSTLRSGDRAILACQGYGLCEPRAGVTAFLADDLGVDLPDAPYPRRVTYHNSCSSIREMGVASQPRKLLKSIDGIGFRNDGPRCVLRLRRGLFNQIPRDFECDGIPEDGPRP